MLMAKELCGVMRQLANTEEKKKIDNGQAGQKSTRADWKVACQLQIQRTEVRFGILQKPFITSRE